MVQVKMIEKPSDQVVAKALAEVQVPDSTGRVFTLRKPGLLAQYRLVEVAGDSAKNEVYLGMIRPLIYIVAIDGDPVIQPINKMQLEALITRIEDHGLSAVMDGIIANYGAQDPEAEKAALKK